MMRTDIEHFGSYHVSIGSMHAFGAQVPNSFLPPHSIYAPTYEPTQRKRVNEYVYLSFIKARDILPAIIIKNGEEVSLDCPSAIQLNIFL